MDRVIERIVSMEQTIAYNRLPTNAVQAARRHLVDAIGCALKGYREPVAEIARALASEVTGARPVSVLGMGRGTTAEMAAFANGVMIRCLDLNDTYSSSGGVGHPSDYIPAVLAAGEEAGAPGTVIIEGIVLAYEVFCRLTDATHYGVTGWDHVCNGVIASAVASAHVLGLAPEEIANAVSLAAISNFALHETRVGVVSMWKGAQSANACRNGVFATQLARRGMTGPEAAFEGRVGIIKVAAPQFDLDLLTTDMDRLAILECHVKRYPAGFFSQSAIDAAREIHRRIGHPARLRSVQLGTFPFGVQVMAGDREKWAPKTRESADHSLPYLVAKALQTGDVSFDAFAPEALADPDVARILSVLSVVEDPDSAASWPNEARNVLEVTLDDGTVERVVVENYLGHSRNPMPDDMISEKFLDGARPLLGDSAADTFLQRLWHVDELSNIDELMATSLVRQPQR
ncbi:MmgE/PrpD family protein [Sulfobacillus harzensis]|uniref:MmgE/PrpD family protein n=1 Tax=Sulfobacillus harzensis TaxID=2729629 RepID=A0A7Y0L2S1_9FIRM|nr:MmgE/PrpD family protein [Sulfobacillus harzensis]NMP22229.1 MmgE/PrpD family protein [Sulfobacillus harzensis]